MSQHVVATNLQQLAGFFQERTVERRI